MRFGIRETIFFLVLMGVPTAAWWYVFKPANAQIAQAQREILAKQQKLRLLESSTRQFDDLGPEIDKLTQAIQLFEDKLPGEKEVDIILKEVWQLAVKHGLTPRSVRPDKIVKGPRHCEQPLKMVIAGDFDGFYSFLLDVERLSRITRIPNMQLQKLTKEGEEGSMQATFTLTIFFEAGESGHAKPAAS